MTQPYLAPIRLYADQPVNSIWRDHNRIEQGAAFAAKYLGTSINAVAPGRIQNSFLHVNKGSAPVINFVWQPYQPTFMESLANIIRGRDTNYFVTNTVVNNYGSQGPKSAAQVKAEKDEKEEEKKAKKANNATVAGAVLFVPLAIALGASLVNLARAIKNFAAARTWQREADAEANYLASWAGPNTDAEKLREMSSRFADLAKSERNSHIVNLVHLTVGIAGAALLVLGGIYTNMSAIDYGKVVTAATLVVGLVRLGMWWASDDSENKANAQAILNLRTELMAKKSGDRSIYCSIPGQAPYWTNETSVQKYQNDYQEALKNHQQQLAYEQYTQQVNQYWAHYSAIGTSAEAALSQLPHGASTNGWQGPGTQYLPPLGAQAQPLMDAAALNQSLLYGSHSNT